MAKKQSRKTKGKKSVAKKKKIAAGIQPKYLLIAALVISGLALSPVLFNDFISLDDDNFILSNPVVQKAQVSKAFSKQLYSPHYKPLVYLFWIAETSVFGNNSFVLHFNNWLLHLINVLLVFFCFRRIAQFWKVTRAEAVWVAFFSALFFGVHPLHVESVAWAIERKDVLFTCFYLAALLNYLRFLDARNQRYLLFAGLFYILSLLSKSMGITLIGTVFLMDWASGRRDWKQMFLDKWPFVIGLVMALYMYGILYQPKAAKAVVGTFGAGAASAPANLAEAPGAFQQLSIANFRYLFFFFHNLIPTKLALVYPREFLLSIPGAAIHGLYLITAAIVALPFLIKKHFSLILTALAFFTMAILPILIEEGPGTNFGSDRYSYVPGIGLMLLVITFVLHKFRGQISAHFTTGRLALLILALVFAVGSFGQARKWNDSALLYNQAISNYPDNWVAMHYRGGTIEDSDPEAAIRDYTKSIELNPRQYKTYFSRGTLLLKQGKYQEAIADFTSTLEIRPNYWKAWVNRGNCYRDLGRNAEAIEDFNVVLARKPRFIKALNNRGVAHLNLRQYQSALSDFNAVLAIDPNYVKGLINRAALYINGGVQQYDNAIADYTRCLQLEPGNVQATYFRGYTFQKLGRYNEALADVAAAIQLSPNNGLYHFSHAQILKTLGRTQESIASAQRAKSLGYNVPSSYLSG